jgi:hypothetical protein
MRRFIAAVRSGFLAKAANPRPNAFSGERQFCRYALFAKAVLKATAFQTLSRWTHRPPSGTSFQPLSR